MIHLHDLTHSAVTGVGNRPRPSSPLSPELTPVPVLVALYRPGPAFEGFSIPKRVAGWRKVEDGPKPSEVP